MLGRFYESLFTSEDARDRECTSQTTHRASEIRRDTYSKQGEVWERRRTCAQADNCLCSQHLQDNRIYLTLHPLHSKKLFGALDTFLHKTPDRIYPVLKCSQQVC